MPLVAPSPDRANGADYSTIADLQHRMETLLNELDKLAPRYAQARQVGEFSSDRRKSALADAFTAIRDGNPEESATAAEHRARSSAGYKKAMKDLMTQQLAAETTIATYHILQTRIEVARSFLAIERTKIERI
jgi:hypothetical protein